MKKYGFYFAFSAITAVFIFLAACDKADIRDPLSNEDGENNDWAYARENLTGGLYEDNGGAISNCLKKPIDCEDYEKFKEDYDSTTPSSDSEDPSSNSEDPSSNSGDDPSSNSGGDPSSNSGGDPSSTSNNSSSSVGGNSSSSTGNNSSSSTGGNSSSSTGGNSSSSSAGNSSSSADAAGSSSSTEQSSNSGTTTEISIESNKPIKIDNASYTIKEVTNCNQNVVFSCPHVDLDNSGKCASGCSITVNGGTKFEGTCNSSNNQMEPKPKVGDVLKGDIAEGYKIEVNCW